MTESGQTASKSAVEGAAADPAEDDWFAGPAPADSSTSGGPADIEDPADPEQTDKPDGPGTAVHTVTTTARPAVPRALQGGESVQVSRVGRFFTRVDQAAGGYAVDLALYALSAAFALVTALSSTLLPHRAWGEIAVWAYSAAFLVATLQFLGHRLTRRRVAEAGRRAWHWRFVGAVFGNGGRAAVTWSTWAAAALLPLVVEAIQRADGRTGRAQEEVLVVEHMGQRLLNDGTPYLSREAIAALPVDERLLAYSPYQPGMSLFGLPRALVGDVWYTDARVWFALVSALILSAAMLLLRPRKLAAEPAGRERRQSFATVRALQAVTVLPICALTLATGGDDIPVLAFCLLALALAAKERYGWAGVAVGAAAACKLFALPVVVVLVVLALATGRAGKLLPGAVGLPILVLVPPFQVDPGAFVENVIRFPLGHGLVTSPAQSPFPGFLLARNVADGRYIALGLLVAVAIAIAVRILWVPPRSAGSAALICGWGLLAAILLMPTTRFGYLLYPIAFFGWAPALGPRPSLREVGTQEAHSHKTPVE